MNRDPRLLAGAIVSGVLLWALAGCAHRESQASRDRLYCRYAARQTPGLTAAQLEVALVRCEE